MNGSRIEPASAPVAQRENVARGAPRSICSISACSPRCGRGASAGSSPSRARSCARSAVSSSCSAAAASTASSSSTISSAPSREVLEERRPTGERPVARGRGQLAAPQRRELLLGLAVVAVSRAIEAGREFEQGVAVGEPLAGRADDRLVESLDGALRLRVEAADRLDLVAEQLDAQRQRLGGREDVEDAAAPRRLAGSLDERAERVTGLDEPQRQRVERDAPAGLEASRACAEVGAARAEPRGGGDGGDDERRLRVALAERESREDGEAALRDRRRCGLTRVGQPGARREVQRGVAEPDGERLGVRLGIALARDQQQRRAAPAVVQGGDHRRLRAVRDAERQPLAPPEAR